MNNIVHNTSATTAHSSSRHQTSFIGSKEKLTAAQEREMFNECIKLYGNKDDSELFGMLQKGMTKSKHSYEEDLLM
jgi:hypothetical protein